MREQFREKKFSKTIKVKLSNKKYYWEKNTFDLVDEIIHITEIYYKKDIKMTVRQLYYQMVSKGNIPNDINVYKKISKILTDLKYNGEIDWDIIEDRVRIPKIPGQWENIPDLIYTAIASFRLPRWYKQNHYVELISEKDALSSTLYPIAHKWHIPFSINRGYTSSTSIYDLYKRILYKFEEGKEIVILYIGDHDPSGIDMCRDIKNRLEEFLKYNDILFYSQFVYQIALTDEQIQKYNPPSNPAKIDDPRAKNYINKYGNESWEVDALSPDVMIELVEESIKQYIDMEKWNRVINKENEQKEKLRKLINNF